MYIYCCCPLIYIFDLFQAILSGGRILKITIDPHVGGATIVEGGHPGFVLSSGYIGSTLLGGAFVLAGWDTLVAKILSFVLGVGLVLPLVLVRDKLYVYPSRLYSLPK
jgi:Peptidase M50B-like